MLYQYQENFLGVKAAGALRLTTYHYPVPLSCNVGTLTSWNPLGHYRPVMGLIYLICCAFVGLDNKLLIFGAVIPVVC